LAKNCGAPAKEARLRRKEHAATPVNNQGGRSDTVATKVRNYHPAESASVGNARDGMNTEAIITRGTQRPLSCKRREGRDAKNADAVIT
jgi:hypothetical protein